MPPIPLPERASLEHLKKQAKLVQQLVADGDPGASDLLREFHPRFTQVTPESPPAEFKLADAQLTVARMYGQASWTRLRDEVELTRGLTRPDPADVEATTEADRLVSLACASYNGDHDPHERIGHARTLLRRNPGLATASTATLAVTGDHERLAAQIAADESVAGVPCGPNGWPPLLYCCYSRLDDLGGQRSTLLAARVLLDAGADPNAGFLWRGLVPPFTALTGALGRGEADQPPHPSAMALARLLLEAGADPNDGQALYNNGLAGTAHDDPAHLRLLVEFGLGTPSDGPWYRRLGGRLTPPADLLYDELEVAAHRGLPRRMAYLVDLGLDLDRPIGRSQMTPWDLATDAGHDDVLAVLAEAMGR